MVVSYLKLGTLENINLKSSHEDVSFNTSQLNLSIPVNLLNILATYKQVGSVSKESGGMLIGSIEKGKAIVSRISLPNSFDKVSRYSFERNKEISEILLEHERINSGGLADYIGEWHTHPEDYPRLSKQDEFMMKAKLKKVNSEDPKIILIIQGIVELAVWCYDGKQIEKLQTHTLI